MPIDDPAQHPADIPPALCLRCGSPMTDLAHHPFGGPWTCVTCRGDSPYAVSAHEVAQREIAQAERDAEQLEQIQDRILHDHLNEEASR
jgi:hypothetical protein